MAAWARFPNKWVRPREDGQQYPLTALTWKDHRVTATAAMVILMALSIRLNLANRDRESFDSSANQIQVTYDELQDMTGFARATISKALMLLEGMEAIKIHKQGRGQAYEIVGIETVGGYCQLPQGYLTDKSQESLARLRDLPSSKVSLNAMKLYVLLLVHRNRRINMTVISYEAIAKQTGIRREDIPKAISHLTGLELVGIAEDELDAFPEVRSRKYKVMGLRPTS